MPWTLREGPEYAGSLEAARQAVVDRQRFTDNLNAARFALQRDPWGNSYPFLDEREQLRVFMTKDPSGGYELVVFFEILREQLCELKWVEVRRLASD